MRTDWVRRRTQSVPPGACGSGSGRSAKPPNPGRCSTGSVGAGGDDGDAGLFDMAVLPLFDRIPGADASARRDHRPHCTRRRVSAANEGAPPKTRIVGSRTRRRHERARYRPTPQGPFPLGRPAAARRAAVRRRADDPRRRPTLLHRQAAAARGRRVPPRDDRPGDLPRDGRARAARSDDPRRIRRTRAELRGLRADRARGRTRRLRLSVDDERAVVARDGADPRVRHRGAASAVPAEARDRRMDRLLRADRTEPRLRPRRR